MNFWWVNHKQTGRQKANGDYIWSPQHYPFAPLSGWIAQAFFAPKTQKRTPESEWGVR